MNDSGHRDAVRHHERFIWRVIGFGELSDPPGTVSGLESRTMDPAHSRNKAWKKNLDNPSRLNLSP